MLFFKWTNIWPFGAWGPEESFQNGEFWFVCYKIWYKGISNIAYGSFFFFFNYCSMITLFFATFHRSTMQNGGYCWLTTSAKTATKQQFRFDIYFFFKVKTKNKSYLRRNTNTTDTMGHQLLLLKKLAAAYVWLLRVSVVQKAQSKQIVSKSDFEVHEYDFWTKSASMNFFFPYLWRKGTSAAQRKKSHLSFFFKTTKTMILTQSKKNTHSKEN